MDVFDLQAVLSLDTREYEEGLARASRGAASLGKTSAALASGVDGSAKSADSAGNAFSRFGDMVKENILEAAIDRAFNGIVDSIKNAGRAIIDFGKQAVQAYAAYEQLAGGVETLFGVNGQSQEEFIKTTTQSLNRTVEAANEALGKYYKNGQLNEKAYFKDVEKQAKKLKLTKKQEQDYLDDAMSKWNEYKDYVGMSEEEIAEKSQETYKRNVKANELVMENAKMAYKAVGISANEYMSQVTGIAASLKQSLGGDTVEAAEAANQALIDMADNANKMGAPLESIQNAYAGFAKQNYTMLDNLKLGYGGTKEEMDRLLSDAQNLTGIKYDINNFADVTKAIHAIQDSLGITGTTAKEAMTTIEGSTNATKAAWDNLLSAIAGGGDIGEAIDGLIDSVFGANEGEGLINQIIPRVQEVIKGIGEFVKTAAPILSKKIPEILKMIGDAILPALPVVLESILTAFNIILSSIFQQLPTFIPVVLNALDMIVDTLLTNLPLIIETAGEFIMAIVTKLADGDTIDKLINATFEILSILVEGFTKNLPILISAIVTIIKNVALALTTPENTNMLIEAVITLIGALAVAIWESLPVILELVIGLLTNIGETLVGWFAPAIELIGGFFKSVWDAVTTKLNEIWQAIKNFFAPLIEFVRPILEAFQYLFSTIFEAVRVLVGRALNSIKNTFSKIWNGIVSFVSPILNSIKTTVSNAFTALVNLVSGPLENVKNTVSNAFNAVRSTISNIVDKAKTWGKDLLDNFINGIKSKITALGNAIKSVADKIKKVIGFSEPDEGPLSNFHTYAPDMIELFTQGLYANERKLQNALSDVFQMPTLDSVSVSGAASNTSAERGFSLAPVFNIYGAEGQDVRELAKAVSEELQNMVNDKRKAYGL